MKIESFNSFRTYTKSDAFRYGLTRSKCYFKYISYRYIYWLRICTYLYDKRYLLPLYAFAKCMYNHYTFKCGIQIPIGTSIGYGLYIGHWGGIVVNGKAIIGNNINLSQGVTIGQSNRGQRKGVAKIGDCTYIGPGVKIVGGGKYW